MSNILIREYSWWSTHPTAIAIGVTSVFISMAMVVSILAVYFASQKQSMFLCFS
jgi:hypothetical protein